MSGGRGWVAECEYEAVEGEGKGLTGWEEVAEETTAAGPSAEGVRVRSANAGAGRLCCTGVVWRMRIMMNEWTGGFFSE